jgi:Mg-chelatase subunit ChlD
MEQHMAITEQQAAQLSEYDFRVIVDASGSMGTEDMPGGRSRWQYMQETCEAFARDVAKFDSDGIDLIVFGGASADVYKGVDAAKVHAVFTDRQPRGSTPLHLAIAEAVKQGKASNKPQFNMVFTDGEPDDRAAVAKLIVQQSNAQEHDEDCTFLFVQVGTDASAREYLRMLDDDLQAKGAKFDIVDAKTQAEAEAFASTAELVLHAISD